MPAVLFQSTRPRGARQSLRKTVCFKATVSIHAPARGATHAPYQRRCQWPGFNPRAREGRDDALRDRAAADLGVSIHAPARGATRTVSYFLPRFPGFNPRAREGRDVAHVVIGLALRYRFNPRAREGRDAGADGALLHVFTVSIHAPARGATISVWRRSM